MTRRTIRACAALLVLLLLGTACGDDESSPTTAAPVTTAAPATTAAPTTEAAATVEVTAVDYGYEGLPGTVAAGTMISLSNASDAELHEFVAIRLPDDEERPAEELLQLPPEELGAFFPLVQTVIITPPGEGEGIPVVGTATLTEPGRYLIICAIPTGADPAEYMAAAAESDGPPEVDGGPPHFVNGMWAEITVEG